MYTDCDIINAINTAKKDSFAEGRAEGIEFKTVEIARKMLQRGMAVEEVAELMDMTIQEIKKIL